MVSNLSLLVSFLALGSAAAVSCGVGQAKLTIDIRYDGNPGQTTVDLVDYSGATITTETLPIAQTANTLISYTPCVSINKLYKVALRDSAGNGLAGQGYASVSVNERLIASISDFGAEAAYYFVADGNECNVGESRAVVNIRYDAFPAETTWSILNTATNGVITSSDSIGTGGSVRDRNVALLANAFLNVDKCIPAPGSFTFAITDADGINSPGFYRFFDGYNLLAVGGAASGTVTTSFTTSDTPAPTPAPTIETCNDAVSEKFMSDEGKLEPCVYLLSRPAKIALLCPADSDFKNLSPNARDVCEETCGKCSDNCPPDDEDAKFAINGKLGRTCEWVRLRLVDNEAFWRMALCMEGMPAWENCNEACNNCPEDVVVTAVPDTTPAPDTPAPINPATPGNGPTAGPTPDPMLTDPCDDSITTNIFINATIGAVPCRWLETRLSEQPKYCAVGNPSNAYNVCEETCGKCTDGCTDSAGTITDKNGVERSCSWLADDPKNRRPLYCDPNSEGWTTCKETCGNCAP